jgi:protein gp37
MNDTTILWKNELDGFQLNKTWNPLYGCKGLCYYCYARRIHNKYRDAYLNGKINNPHFAVPFETIQVFRKRFEQPAQEKKPCVIFVDDMGDICYHKKEDVQSVIDVVAGCLQHKFLFLTKQFDFYNNYIWPLNAWLGITMQFGRLSKTSKFNKFKQVSHPYKFISIEPIMGMFDTVDLSFARWVIVGGMNRVSAEDYIKPLARWVNSIKHRNIFFKDEITRNLRSV